MLRLLSPVTEIGCAVPLSALPLPNRCSARLPGLPDAQATEQSINSAAPAIARARVAEKRWRETGVEETVPAVAADNGDVAMPLAEAFAYYGTPRGAVPN